MKDREYPNQMTKLLMERASCRSFSDKRIPAVVMQLVLEAGIHAPTGWNLQPYSIIKIENDETKQKLAEMCGQGFISQAPVLLLFCIDWYRVERWARLSVAPFTATRSFRHFWISFQDTILCAQNLCTAADSMGLGSVYVGAVVEFLADVRDMFQLPQGVLPVVLLCLGYPKTTRPQPQRKLSVDVIVHSERYREMEDQEIIDAFGEKYHGQELEITEERLETITEVCREVHGEEFARRCLARIDENGYINRAQRDFGLECRADSMLEGNERYLGLMEEFGFDWFEVEDEIAELHHAQVGESNVEIIKGSRHQKIIGDFGENLICNWLSRSGFEVALVDHTGIDVVAYHPPTKQRLGITVKSRTRDVGKQDESVNLLSYQKVKSDREKLSDACNAFACEPWIAVYVETPEYADVYLTSLENFDREYRGGKAKSIDTWKMTKKYKERYEQDSNVKHIRIEFHATNWEWFG